MNYTPEQLAAIETEAPDVVALAGPGSGKTATLVARIKTVISRETEPEKIAALTFTNAGANEIAERVQHAGETAGGMQLYGTWKKGADGKNYMHGAPSLGFVGTLHSFALRMLREHGGKRGYGARLSLISPESAADLLSARAHALAKRPPPMTTLLEIKTRGPSKSPRFDLAETIVATFRAEMRAANLLDYDMLLQEFADMLEAGDGAEIRDQFSHLFVDEVQDSAPLDWRIYRALPIASKFYVGDSDQAIYGFRGGRVTELIGHALDLDVVTFKLEQNFRSRPVICAAAQSLIERNAGRVKKETRSAREDGGFVEVLAPAATDGEEIAVVARAINRLRVGGYGGVVQKEQSIAVLARTNAIADQFRKGLPGAGVPVVETKRAGLPADFKLARAFVELCHDPENDALATFYLVARGELAAGANPSLVRADVHRQRLDANARGMTLNGVALHFAPITRPEFALEALATFACRETRAIAGEVFANLPLGSGVLDLALGLAGVREYETEGEGDGVRVLTMHAAKGREFDAVFVVGFEDEVIPGRMNRGVPDSIEEERRLAYVAATRARDYLFFSWAASRSSKWVDGEKRTPSRFLAEFGLSIPCEHPASNP